MTGKGNLAPSSLTRNDVRITCVDTTFLPVLMGYEADSCLYKQVFWCVGGFGLTILTSVCKGVMVVRTYAKVLSLQITGIHTTYREIEIKSEEGSPLF